MKWYVSAPFTVTVCCFGVLRGSVTLKSRAEGLCTFGKCGRCSSFSKACTELY